jgi:hypothetical protein
MFQFIPLASVQEGSTSIGIGIPRAILWGIRICCRVESSEALQRARESGKEEAAASPLKEKCLPCTIQISFRLKEKLISNGLQGATMLHCALKDPLRIVAG